MERRRTPVAAPHDHAVALAGAAVARRAEDVEALLPARHHRSRRPRNGNTVARRRRSPCRCRAARRLAAARARPCPRPAAAPSGRRRRTSTRAAACTSADRACPGGSREREHRRRTQTHATSHAEDTRHAEPTDAALRASASSVRDDRAASPQRSSPPAASSVSRKRARRLEVELRVAAPRCTGRSGCGSPARSAAR